jgi:hypothetical protein
MGKHGTEYARVERDLYPTPPWVVIDALAVHVNLRGLNAWEFACGRGGMATALRAAGCAHVHSSDITDHRNGQDETLDFLSPQEPKVAHHLDLLVTNPPFGLGGRLATAFIAAGLGRLPIGATLALLLPCDFDSAKTRPHLFGDCPHFVGKIVLRERIVWFERNDGEREAPRENHAWFLWQRNPLRVHRLPVLLYAPMNCERGGRRDD